LALVISGDGAWPWTSILQISASEVTRIIGTSHGYLVLVYIYIFFFFFFFCGTRVWTQDFVLASALWLEPRLQSPPTHFITWLLLFRSTYCLFKFTYLIFSSILPKLVF
jgi:hypothetical protein